VSAAIGGEAMTHHTHDPVCPACEEKKKTAYPYMRTWFDGLKKKRPTAHISWSSRGKEEQEDAFSQGLTRCHYPNSPHNRINPVTKEPESYALDLFELTPEGFAKFDPMFYAAIAHDAKENGDEIIWGGNFKSIGDSDHFQFNPNAHT